MGNFAKRDLHFHGKGFKAKWKRREAKQTDVAIGVHCTRDAFCDVFDRALIISCDIDLLPAFRLVKKDFPEKTLITVAPLSRTHHRDLLSVADAHLVIKRSQIERALFGRVVTKEGKNIAVRPAE